jgi:hypothetical protein
MNYGYDRISTEDWKGRKTQNGNMIEDGLTRSANPATASRSFPIRALQAKVLRIFRDCTFY